MLVSGITSSAICDDDNVDNDDALNEAVTVAVDTAKLVAVTVIVVISLKLAVTPWDAIVVLFEKGPFSVIARIKTKTLRTPTKKFLRSRDKCRTESNTSVAISVSTSIAGGTAVAGSGVKIGSSRNPSISAWLRNLLESP
jgi:predicted secreted protein